MPLQPGDTASVQHPLVPSARWQPYVIGLLTALAIAGFWNFKALGLLHDDACYLLNALAMLGKAPSDPNGFARGPSLMVLPYLYLTNGDLTWVRLVPAFFTTAWVLLFYTFAQRCLPTNVAFPLTLATIASSGFLINASNVMGEPFFCFFIWLALSLALAKRTPTISFLLVLACLGVSYMRTEGIVITLAIALHDGMQGRLRQGLLTIGAVVGLTGLISFLLATTHQATYSTFIKDYFASLPQLSQYPALWAQQLLSVLGETYWLGLPPGSPFHSVAILGGGLFLAVAFKGWLESPLKSSAGLAKLVAFVLLGALFFWPYLQPRHLLSVWPLLLLFALLGVPASRRSGVAWAFVAILLALGVPNLARGMKARAFVNSGFQDTTRWIRDFTPSNAVLMSGMRCAYEILAQRRSVSTPTSVGYENILGTALENRATYLIFESASKSLADPRGVRQTDAEAMYLPWVSRSTMFKEVFSNQTQTIFSVHIPESVRESYSDYARSLSLDQAQQFPEKERLLKAALARTPDLPFVSAALGELYIRAGKYQQARETLEAELLVYPFDLPSLYNLCLACAQLEDKEKARALAKYGLELAVQIGQTELASKFQAVIDAP